ncbi:ferritin-like domain-containing protein [Sphingomonas sp. PB1R3]
MDRGLESRRGFLGVIGGVSAMTGIAILSSCKDDVVGAENVPAPTATSTTAVSVPPTYTATDTDRLNFALQLHYLVASFLQVGLNGSALAANLTSGSGTSGQVSGGRRVTFSDQKLLAILREVTNTTTARVAFLRKTLGSAVTAQPAISIAGGQNSAFQAFSVPTSTTAPTSFYDPYASENDFLLAAVGLSAVLTSAMDELAWNMAASTRLYFGPLTAGVAATDSALRNVLFTRASVETTPANGQPTLFTLASRMASARNPFDGPGNRDQDIGSRGTSPNIGITDGANWVAIRRSPEQALGILYTSVLSVSSGGFFPAGINGTIRYSGANS